MKKVLISDLKPNDILAADIISENGVLIIKSGLVLNEKSINRINNSNISGKDLGGAFVFIEGDPNDESDEEKASCKSAELSEELLKQRDEEISLLEKRFQRVIGVKYMEEIKNEIKSIIIDSYDKKRCEDGIR